MDAVSPVVEPCPPAGAGRTRAHARAWWLVAGCYVLAAVALTWRLWASPASRLQSGNPADIDLVAWFLSYSASAVAHGSLPGLVTAALNAPQGVNLMWNASVLLPGLVLSPVTLLAGPQVSLTIMLTVGYAGSAASLLWVLRRWGASDTAAALGGLIYGFSPALLDAGTSGHYQVQFAVLPPLIIDAALRIVTGRGRPVREGAWLGVLVAAQLFTGEELLVETALAGAVLVALVVAGQPGQIARRAPAATQGLLTGAGVALLICGYGLWVQFHGPLAEHGSPWSVGIFRNLPAAFVVPSGQMLFHTQSSAQSAARDFAGLGEYLAYLGWPLLAVLLAAAIRYWHDRRVRVLAMAFAWLEIFSLGGGTAFLPWHWLQDLPLLGQVLPDRISILADGLAAALLAFSLDAARRAMPSAAGWRRALPAAVAVLAVLPLTPVPLPAYPVTPVPAGWQAAFSRLRLAPQDRVLVVPVPGLLTADVLITQAMRWQADTSQPGSLIGGWCIAPGKTGQARVCPGSSTAMGAYLDALWRGAHPRAPSPVRIRADFASWHPAAVVAVTSPDSRLAQFLTGFLGSPGVRTGSVLSWRIPATAR